MMKYVQGEKLEALAKNHRLDGDLAIWGIGEPAGEIIEWLREYGYGSNIKMVVDNFKASFYQEFHKVPVRRPKELLRLESDSVSVLFALEHSDGVRKQLGAYGITNAYNLRNLPGMREDTALYRHSLPYHFVDRSKGKTYLCYILAGYEPKLWNSTLARIEAFQSENVDYCLISSGKYDSVLDKIAEMNGWSYLYTEQNQVCFIQNLAIELHPNAQYIFKMDEDIFIGKDFFHQMIQEFHQIEEQGEYWIGFAVPVIPLNCCGYVTYLNGIGKKKEYEKRFGRVYRSRFSEIYLDEIAKFLWDTMDSFDEMAERFLKNSGYNILGCFYNIGCILFTRERWHMMGKWPEKPGETGMGRDEEFIFKDNIERDMPIYEISSVLAGHLAFGPQKAYMLQYYEEHFNKFDIHY